MLRYFRYVVISFTALLVLSLGFALIPAERPGPGDPPFSEQARLAALQDALDLRTAAVQLSAEAAAGGAANAGAAEETVTLLTLQARALLSPSDSSSFPGASASASSPPAGSQVPSTAATEAPAAVPTGAGLAAALSASAARRLADAAAADGGMARLLAGVGTAQLLAAESLAAASGVAVATLPPAGAGTTQATGSPAPTADPTASACPLQGSGTAPPKQETKDAETGAALGNMLAAAVAAEQQRIYAYQAALSRLGPDDARAAATFLGQHEELAAEAAVHSRAACTPPPAQQPGFVLAPGFLAAPVDGLGSLELAALPAYGDIVAQAEGHMRTWAIAALQSGARRAVHWGSALGPVPGVVLDQGKLPELPPGPTARPTGS
ncbi:DUF4439 domain-containing protein [Arthrobacter sp. AFG7.2]|uniref:DUF4439 domain-containing protein n=1 Tax=Arthrobacter sp. AFG7.2 TaxID=1688693 RepID=UPI001CB96981|nr:DUF4439 domain-containing protein [Arthrobacter sp. AFG7.2]